MSAFGGLILTNKGRNLQAKAQTGVQLNFTKIKIGDGVLSGQSIVDLTDLISTKKELTILGLQTLSGGKAKLRSYLSNADITTGFYWRELGIFAQDPDEGEVLYCYGNAGANAEYIPAGGGPDVIERYINVIALIGNASNISATLGSEIYVTQADFNSHKEAATLDHPDNSVTDQKIGVRSADPSLVPASNGPGKITEWISWLANRIKAITGKTNWYDAPDITLATLAAHKTRHATGGADALTPADIGAAPSSHTHTKSQITDFAHKSTHASGGSDALTPADIGAATASDLVSHLADKTMHISGNPICILRHSLNQSIPDATWTAISFDTEILDNDNMHDVSVNDWRITIRTPGRYLLIGNISFHPNATGYRSIGLRKNGSAWLGVSQAVVASSSASTIIQVVSVTDCAVNDYIELLVLQSSGNTLICAASNGILPLFIAVKVG